jgi:hypothetical protein
MRWGTTRLVIYAWGLAADENPRPPLYVLQTYTGLAPSPAPATTIAEARG